MQSIMKSTHPGNLNDVEHHRDGNTVVLEVDSECNVGLVVWRSPCIGGEAQRAIILLGIYSSAHVPTLAIMQKTYSEHLCDPLTSLSENSLYITRDRTIGRDVCARPTGLHQTLEAPVVDNIEGAETFSYPAHELCPVKSPIM